MSEAVVFENVGFTYPGGALPALRDVNLVIPEGALVLVTGPTASGKSTLLRSINGLVPHFTGGAFAGRVLTGGRDTIDGAPRDLADTVAYVPQDPAASFVVDRVEDEVAYGMENLGTTPQVMRRRVEEMLDLLALEALRSRSVRSLSGGERQRVAIASALATGARILVLDEPTSQLDPQGAEDVIGALQRMVHDLGLTVVLAEHRLERVAGYADLVVRCEGGRVSAGDPGEVLAGSPAAPPVTRVGRELGWSPVPLTVRDARRLAGSLPGPAPSVGRDPGRADTLLRVKDLGAAYERRAVLHRVGFEVAPGETVCLLGRNGSGKTTLFRCLAGLHPGHPGSIRFFPRSSALCVTFEGQKRGEAEAGGTRIPVALCPQAPETILFKETVGAEVAATIEWSGSSVEPDALIDALGLGELIDRHPRDLSAGQRVLAATAASAATGARLLLLDEPTKGLDPVSKTHLISFLTRRAEQGDASIVATHDVEFAAEFATRVLMLAAGELIADGTPTEVLGDSAVFAPQMTRVFGPGWLTPAQVIAAVSPVSGAPR